MIGRIKQQGTSTKRQALRKWDLDSGRKSSILEFPDSISYENYFSRSGLRAAGLPAPFLQAHGGHFRNQEGGVGRRGVSGVREVGREQV